MELRDRRAPPAIWAHSSITEHLIDFESRLLVQQDRAACEPRLKIDNHHVPRLLHQLRFSVQRPRERLARANLAQQETWLRETLPAILKKRVYAEASLPLATKPASGSMARSI